MRGGIFCEACFRRPERKSDFSYMVIPGKDNVLRTLKTCKRCGYEQITGYAPDTAENRELVSYFRNRLGINASLHSESASKPQSYTKKRFY